MIYLARERPIIIVLYNQHPFFSSSTLSLLVAHALKLEMNSIFTGSPRSQVIQRLGQSKTNFTQRIPHACVRHCQPQFGSNAKRPATEGLCFRVQSSLSPKLSIPACLRLLCPTRLCYVTFTSPRHASKRVSSRRRRMPCLLVLRGAL
jgi:hypothetical protein